MDIESCPVCGETHFEIKDESDHGNTYKIQCAICGEYWIGRVAALRIKGQKDLRLSAWIRSNNLRSPGRPIEIVKERLQEILAGLPSVDIGARPLKLLESLALLTKTAGQPVSIMPSIDFPLAWSEGEDELVFHLEALKEDRSVTVQSNLDGTHSVVVTHAGWKKVSSSESKTSDVAFVAMSFSDELTEIWTDGIKPGIESAGYEAKRVDSDPHVGRIDLKILGDIRAARFVVADVTQQKQGVYFEAGFALALDKPVIWTVRQDEIEKVHFDTRQFAHILWKDATDLGQKLTDVIRGVIGEGPKSK